jgi:hypothetical protein
MLVAGFDAAEKMIDGGGLITARLIGALELECH